MGGGRVRKVCLISDMTKPYFGGMESHAREFFNHFISDDPNNRFFVMFPKGGEISELGLSSNSNVSKIPFSSTSDFAEFARFCPAEKDAIFFFNSIYWVRVFADLRKASPNAKIVLRSGGNDILQAQLLDVSPTHCVRQSFVVGAINEYVDVLVVNSQYSFDRFVSLGINPLKMKIVAGGVDLERFCPISVAKKSELREMLGILPDAKVILSAARFVPFKRVDFTLRLFSSLSDPTLVLLLSGDGPEYENLKPLIEADSRVRYLGATGFDQMPNLYGASDLYLQNPIYYEASVPGGKYIHTETMGRTFCEAAACAIPSICTNVGGVAQIIDPNTGILIDGLDQVRFAREISSLIADESRRLLIGINARKKAVEQLGFDTVFATYQRDVF